MKPLKVDAGIQECIAEWYGNAAMRCAFICLSSPAASPYTHTQTNKHTRTVVLTVWLIQTHSLSVRQQISFLFAGWLDWLAIQLCPCTDKTREIDFCARTTEWWDKPRKSSHWDYYKPTVFMCMVFFVVFACSFYCQFNQIVSNIMYVNWTAWKWIANNHDWNSVFNQSSD